MTSPALQDIVALLGCPAAGNPAQYLFERAIAAAEIDARFVTVDVAVERLADALAGAAAMGFRGCLLSGPLREAALPLVAAPSPAATFAGAVSLVERQAGPLAGHMTDGRGAVEAIRGHVDPAGRRVLVIGAGASGRATALELALAGAATIHVSDPDAAAAAALAEAVAGVAEAKAEPLAWAAPLAVPADTDIVVVAPAAGGGEAAPECAGLQAAMVVAEIALVAGATPVARQAKAAGACFIDGIEIHAARTAIEFHTLFGVETDPDMLRDALDEFFS